MCRRRVHGRNFSPRARGIVHFMGFLAINKGGSGVVPGEMRHGDELYLFRPTDILPELDGFFVIVEDEELVLADANAHEGMQAAPHQRAPQPVAAVVLVDCQVIDIATAAVVAAQHGTDKLFSIPDDKAEAGIALEEAKDTLL